jgi:hypothetical protein
MRSDIGTNAASMEILRFHKTRRLVLTEIHTIGVASRLSLVTDCDGEESLPLPRLGLFLRPSTLRASRQILRESVNHWPKSRGMEGLQAGGQVVLWRGGATIHAYHAQWRVPHS